MNVFQRLNILHLSASQLTMYAADPSRWYGTKVLGYRSPSSAAMERGKAVEAGVACFLKGVPLEDAIDAAEQDYDKATRFSNILGDIPKERGNIAPMIEQAAPAVKKFGPCDFPESGQHRIEIPVRFGPQPEDVIPIIGFMDFVFEDRVIDLKSTKSIPSDMSFAHRIQAAIYARTTNKPVQFLYVSPKRTLLLEDPDTVASQAAVRAIVQRMANFLSLSADKEILAAACPVIVDGWSWRGEETARQRLFGI